MPRTLALLDPFSCSRKTKNKGTLISAIYQLGFETIGWFLQASMGRHLGVKPSMNYRPNPYCLYFGAKYSLGARNVMATLPSVKKYVI